MIKSNKSFIKAGASVLLLKPNSKVPVHKKWTEKPIATYEDLLERHDNHNVGVRLGKYSKIRGHYLHVLDVDIRSMAHEKDAHAKLAELLLGYDFMSFPRVKSGSGGLSFHIYFVTDRPFRSKKLAYSEGFAMVFDKARGRDVQKWDWEIELFGTGKQVVIPPSIHPNSGNTYEWTVDFDFEADLPLVESTDLEALVDDPDQSIHSDDILGLSAAEVRKYLANLDLDYWCEDYHGWIKVGMALHHEFEGDKTGLQLWCEFSKQSAKFSLKEVCYLWRTFKSGARRPTTFRTIIKAALDHQWALDQEAVVDLFDDIDDEYDIADEFESLPPLSGDVRMVRRTEVQVRRNGDVDLSVITMTKEPAPQLPLDCFPARLARIVRNGALRVSASDDFVFSSILAGASMCIGNSRRIMLKDGYVQPGILWIQNIGIPSSKKTPALSLVTNILDNMTARRMVPYNEAMKQWQHECDRADLVMKDWVAQQKAKIAAGDEADVEPPASTVKPSKPPRPYIYMIDQTIEAFYRAQEQTPRGFGVVHDELATFMNNMERYSKSSDRGAWLSAFDGRLFSMERVKDDGRVIHIPRICAPIIGGIQPERLLSIVSQDVADDGFQARFLPFWPDYVKRSMKTKTGGVEDLEMIFERLASLAMEKDEYGNFAPFICEMEDDAFEFYAKWSDKLDGETAFMDSRLQGILGKGHGQVGRLALVIHHLIWACDEFKEQPPKTISLESVKVAIRLYDDYIRPTQKRIFTYSLESKVLNIARSVAFHIIDNKLSTLNARTLRREGGIKGVHTNTDPAMMDEVFGHLVERRWLFKSEDEKDRRGGRPKKEFRVNPRLWEQIEIRN